MNCFCLRLFSQRRFFCFVISLALYGLLRGLLNAQELNPRIQRPESPQKEQDTSVPNQPSNPDNPPNDSRFEPLREQEIDLNSTVEPIPKATPKWKSPQNDVKTPKDYSGQNDPLDSFEKEKTKEIPLAPKLPKQKFENKTLSPQEKPPSRSSKQVTPKAKEKKKPNNLKQVNTPRYKKQKRNRRPEKQSALKSKKKESKKKEATKEKKPTSQIPFKVEKRANPKIPNKNTGELIERLPNFEMSFLPGYNKISSSRLTTLPHQAESYSPSPPKPKEKSVQSSQSRKDQEQDFFQDLHERFTDSGGGERTLLNISLLTALIAVFAVFRLRRRRRKGY